MTGSLDAGSLELGPVKDAVRRHWEGRAPTFDDGASHGLLTDEQRAAWTDRVREWAGPDPVDALDVGCGTGFFSLLLAGLGHRPVGVDVADAMLARARDKAAVAGLEADFRSATPSTSRSAPARSTSSSSGT